MCTRNCIMLCVGSLPSELGNLRLMTALYASINHFTGNIPSELGYLTLLNLLSLSFNSLEGAVHNLICIIHRSYAHRVSP